MKRLFVKRWIPEPLYAGLPWAAVVSGGLGMAFAIGWALWIVSAGTLAYGSFVLGLRLAWCGCGEV